MKKTGIVVSAIFSGVLAASDWTPVVGRLVQTDVSEDLATGKKVEIRKEGLFLRSTDGSVFRDLQEFRDGKPSRTPETSLMEARTGRLVRMNRHSKTAMLMEESWRPEFFHGRVGADSGKSWEERIENTLCRCYPVRGGAITRGKRCFSIADEVEIVMEFESILKGRRNVFERRLTEWTRTAPDSRFFSVPSDYVWKERSCTRCEPRSN